MTTDLEQSRNCMGNKDLVAPPASQEEWRAVPGFYPYYIVSSWGRVRNIDTGKLLFGYVDDDGYRRVCLSKNGKSCQRRVHRLVCEAFHGPAPTPAHEVGHLNGKRLFNRADNLKWVTRSENASHMVAHGTVSAGPPTMRGEGHARSRLSETDAREIKRRIQAGERPKAVGAAFGIASSHAYNIGTGRAWKHLGETQNV